MPERQLATQYLANPRMRITDIADMLGYSSIGAFTRWHAKSFGCHPERCENGVTPQLKLGPGRVLIELLYRLIRPVSLLMRVLYAQVTRTKPLQVH